MNSSLLSSCTRPSDNEGRPIFTPSQRPSNCDERRGRTKESNSLSLSFSHLLPMPPARKSNTATGKPYRRGDALSQLGKPSKSTKKTAQRPSAPPVVAAPVAPLSEEEEEWGGIPDEVSEAEEGQEEGKLVRKSGKKGKKFLESQVRPFVL